MLADAYGLSCARGDKVDCKGRCEHMAGKYLSTDWDRCPVAEVTDDARLMVAIGLDRAEQAGFAVGSVDEYAAWVPALLSSYKAARQDRAQRGQR